MTSFLEVPERRARELRRVLEPISRARSVMLTTHVNADGDGAGSEAAFAAWLAGRGVAVRIVNPTPYPAAFGHLCAGTDWVANAGTPDATRAAASADLLVVLDTGEPKRIGRVASLARGLPVVVVDHHLASRPPFEGVVVQDASACATGELLYDLFLLAGEPKPWPAPIIEALYTAIVTDTGSFRFSNTTPRAHAIASDLIHQGVDPEREYRRIYANVPLRRVRVLKHALDGLAVDPVLPLTWITIDRATVLELGATSDDLDGVIDHARDVEGTEIAALFRGTSDGQTKVSLRSSGSVDVNAIARRFGGGGHVKASGALLPMGIEEATTKVLEAVRDALRSAGLDRRVVASQDGAAPAPETAVDND